MTTTNEDILHIMAGSEPDYVTDLRNKVRKLRTDYDHDIRCAQERINIMHMRTDQMIDIMARHSAEINLLRHSATVAIVTLCAVMPIVSILVYKYIGALL